MPFAIQKKQLPNYVLSKNMSIFYNNKAFVETDTPAKMLRWIPQQTRWCKSFYREFFYNVKSFHFHSVWMAVELVFQFIYPFIIVTLLWFINRSLDQMMIVFFFLVMMSTIRGFFGFLRTGQLRFMHYGIYVFLYITCLIPSKLWSIITLWNNDWGTSSRFQRYQSYIKAIHAIVWSIGFAAYIGTFIILHLIDKQKVTMVTAYGALGAFCFIVFLVVHWNIQGNFFLIPQDKKLLEMRYQKAGVVIDKNSEIETDYIESSAKHMQGVDLSDEIKTQKFYQRQVASNSTIPTDNL